jgi:hypothetical protein
VATSARRIASSDETSSAASSTNTTPPQHDQPSIGTLHGLLDELRLLVHPVLVGVGLSITAVLGSPRRLADATIEPGSDGRATLTYRVSHVE